MHQMIIRTAVLLGLLVASASSSAIKGREEYATKGGRTLTAPADYQRQQYEQREAYAAKGQETTRRYEQAPPAEQAKLAESELYQQREEKQQFYEAQPQLREADCKGDCKKPLQAAKTEERTEEQTRLAQLPEQTRYEDYQQQREEPAEQAKQELKSAVKTEASPVAKALQREETKQVAYEKQQYYEAKPQVREEAPPALVVAQAKGEPLYTKAEERREEQYIAQAPAEPTRLEETKGQRYESQREELKTAAKGPAIVQRAEQQEPIQQAVELVKQEYEQRRFEEQTEQRAEEQVVQVREEGQLKGGLRPPGAEAEPYAFDYAVEGSSRRESGDQHGVVRGQYTLQGPDGTQRIVDYIADRDGFRAQVQTNEFGTESQQPANVALRSSQPSAEGISLRLEGKTRESVAAEQAQHVRLAATKTAPLPLAQTVEIARARPVYEETRSYKGAPAAAKSIAETQLELKAPPALETAPYKGQRAEEPAPVYQQRPLEPIKSAELRAAPRAAPVAAQPRSGAILTRASGFESATAYRPVVHAHPVPVVRQVPVVRHQLLAPVRGHQHHHHRYPVQPLGVSRSQLQHDRYPPVSYRREQPPNPRVSFYANNYEDEHSAGFEHPIEAI